MPRRAGTLRGTAVQGWARPVRASTRAWTRTRCSKVSSTAPVASPGPAAEASRPLTWRDGAGAGTSCSSGMTPEEHERLKETPDGPMFLQYLLGLSGPLRIPDMVCHVRSLCLPEFQAPVPAESVLATSLRNRGRAWGVICLAKGEEAGLGSPPRAPFCRTGVIALRRQRCCLGLQQLADGVRPVPRVTSGGQRTGCANRDIVVCTSGIARTSAPVGGGSNP